MDVDGMVSDFGSLYEQFRPLDRMSSHTVLSGQKEDGTIK
jgi:hypothetical protein